MLVFALSLSRASADVPGDVPIDEIPKGCESCAEWSVPRAPFRLFGDSWYVGTAGLSSVVVDTGDGLVLLDGILPESVAGTVANLEALGLSIATVRFILVSHAHFDHVGGVAALQRRSGATVVATAAAAEALRAGDTLPGDPQAGEGGMSFPPVIGPIRTLPDGASLEVGRVIFTLHATPGHTPGGASYHWQSCEGKRCAEVVYADSLNAVSADGFRFGEDRAALDAFRASIARVRDLPCDVMIPVHPSFGSLFERAERADTRGSRALVDRRACRRYAAAAAARLDQRLAQEAAGDR